MPEKTAPLYQWLATFRDTPTGVTVEAAYSVIETTGHMVLKNAAGHPVFTAEPGLGCTFKRGARAEAGAMAAFVSMLSVAEAETARLVAAGKMSINAGRRELGLPPFDLPEADQSLKVTGDGAQAAGCCGEGSSCSSCA